MSNRRSQRVLSSAREPRVRDLSLSHTRKELGVLCRLSLPILLTNVCWMAVGLVDLLMLGRWSSEAVAAALLAGVWVHLTQVAGIGLVMGIDPIVTQGHGARDREALGRALQRGIIVALLASVPVVCLRFFTAELIAASCSFAEWIAGSGEGLTAGRIDVESAARLDQPSERYALSQSFATPFFLVYIAFRQHLQGRGILKPALAVAVIANAVNVFANWLLIFELGWGITGAGIATGITRTFMCLAILWVVRRHRLLRGAWVSWDRASRSLAGIAQVLRYGAPVALHLTLELGAFGATTYLAGMLGIEATVAHGVVINMASMTFMVPLGIALAAATRIGNLIGERRFRDAQSSAQLALGLSAVAMAALGMGLYLGRHWLPSLYIPDDPDALSIAARILPIAAAFQIVDGLQVVGAGILRGMGRTVPPAVFNFIAWWVIALPLAGWFVLRRGDGLIEVWWSLALGLGVVAVLIVAWVFKRGPASLSPPSP